MMGTRKQGLPLIALGLGIVLLVFLIGFPRARVSQRSDSGLTSSFFPDASGTKALYLVLQRLLPSVERWLKPLHQLPDPGPDGASSLLILGPERALGRAEADRLDAWVRGGGQLVIATETPWPLEHEEASYLDRHGFHFAPTASGPAQEELPEEYVGSTGTLLLAGGALERGDYRVLFGGSKVKAGLRSLGEGRIVVVADRKAWSNRRLRESSNAFWLVSAVSAWGNGRVLVDEYHHGFQRTRGAASLMLAFLTSFRGLVFVQLALAGLLYLAAEGRRFGPLFGQPETRKRHSFERVEAIGALLQAAEARRFADSAVLRLRARRLRHSRFIQPGEQAGVQEAIQIGKEQRHGRKHSQ